MQCCKFSFSVHSGNKAGMRIAQATDWSWSIWIDLTFLISVFLLSKSKVHQWIWIFIFFDLLLHKLKWLFSRVWTAWKTWRTWRRGSVRRTCRWSSPWMARTWRLPWPPPRQPYFDHTQDNYILIKEDLDLKQPEICIFIPHKAMWFGELFRINCVEQIFVVLFGTSAPIHCSVFLWKP